VLYSENSSNAFRRLLARPKPTGEGGRRRGASAANRDSAAPIKTIKPVRPCLPAGRSGGEPYFDFWGRKFFNPKS